MDPNFLLICVDQMQAQCLGCADHPDVRTPNLDALAKDGTLFTRAYCNNPICQPSRATMITGLMPSQHGLEDNGQRLPVEIPTVPAVLTEHGYRTHAVGKLHLQPFSGGDSWENRHRWYTGEIESLPSPYYGYQTTDFVGGHVHYISGDYRRWLEVQHPEIARPEDPRSDAKHCIPYSDFAAYERPADSAWKIDALPSELHYNNWIADRTIQYLGTADPAIPFFLWCSFPDPHHPFAACKPYSEMYRPGELHLPETYRADERPGRELSQWYGRSRFRGSEVELRAIMAQTYGMISHVDDNVGRILEALRRNGLADNTVVMFLADHGEYLGSHHMITKTPAPFEDLIRVPFILRDPSAKSGRCNEVVSTLDITPTILDYAGIQQNALKPNLPEWYDSTYRLPGSSLRSLERPTSDRSRREAGRSTTLEYSSFAHGENLAVLVDQRYKISVGGDGSPCNILVDMQQDPAETRNLWDDGHYRRVKTEMLERLVGSSLGTRRFTNPKITDMA